MSPPSEKSRLDRTRRAAPAAGTPPPPLPPAVKTPEAPRPVIPGTNKQIGRLARTSGGRFRTVALS